MSASADLAAQIRLALQSLSFPLPSVPWLTSLVASRNPPPPLPSLIATAKARLLATDLTTPQLLDPSSPCLPSTVTGGGETREARLPVDVVVQVLDVENLSKSRWEQVEELEAIARGEQRTGRRIVRLPARNEDEDGDGGQGDIIDAGPSTGPGSNAAQRSQQPQAPAAATAHGTHRLVVQDWRGTQLFAVELKPVPRVGVGVTSLGEKMVLRAGSVVARGTILLEPATCVVLGGKVEAWQAAWVAGRLEKLKEAVGGDEGPRR